MNKEYKTLNFLTERNKKRGMKINTNVKRVKNLDWLTLWHDNFDKLRNLS